MTISAGTAQPDTGEYPVVRLIAAFTLMTVGLSAMYATIVVLKPVAIEFQSGRGAASLPYMLFMLGFGLGGVMMGRIADRIGILVPLLIAGVALPASFFAAAQAQTLWQFCLAQSVAAGLLGASSTFSPLVSDISHWFTKRRGLALAIVISGSYMAGTIWPPVLQALIDQVGWRDTFMFFGILTMTIMLPLTAVLARRTPLSEDPTAETVGPSVDRPLGFSFGTLQCLVCVAGIGCCAAMAMPQVHIVAYATDLGFEARDGALMLSLMLGFGIISRLVSGWISDFIGGLGTLVLGSTLQGAALVGFLFIDSLEGLYVLACFFGLSQGGIVPSYAMIVRAFFPAGDAGWRIGLSLLFTMIGMALGGWMAGALYDYSGDYTLAFMNAIGFNVLNLVIALLFIARMRRRSAAPTAL